MSKDNEQKKYKSAWFRVATAGDTTDGREISAEWIQQMAQSYSPQTYGARINVEHIRSALPDSSFGAYGDVTALKTEKVTVDGVEKDALFAQIQPNQNLLDLNKKNQKIYTSIEVNPNFAKTGKAYLVGLAVTDSPASLGTEQLIFAAGASVNPLASRKLDPENLFAESHEVTFDFTEEKQKTSIIDTVKNMFKANKGEVEQNFSQNEAAILEIAQQTATQGQSVDTLQNDFTALKTEFSALKEQLNITPAKEPRPKSTNSVYSEEIGDVDC
ncbi:GPO family capsid scaffolding protein [Acinetobacter sp. B5B]|uniref:GPO family capsid scaffolding protein n=1 Tax=Acinetobacter baretiae TaxID=2605383 RepID=UPI0018C2394A|nr:GPO family capsid scaffolding protein [Acinetobacter baretiae]MBF7683873.1 GPO family capsid scaffolding protein [Acinetobacter baretiae]